MKNLGKTIDRILKIEPDLGPHLIPIKNRWIRYPKKDNYWKQVLNILNTTFDPQNPKRTKIQEILSTRHRKIRNQYSFEFPTRNEVVIGVIPEHLEEQIRKYDRKHIELSKLGLEATLTHNISMCIELNRKLEILDHKQKNIWIKIKDHFKLWSIDSPSSFFIRKRQDNILVLTTTKIPESMQGNPESISQLGESLPTSSGLPNFPGLIKGEHPENFLMKLDPETLRRFFKFLNINPPPGLLPPE